MGAHRKRPLLNFSEFAIASLVAIGVWLRLNHLQSKRTFWYDELSIIDNLMMRGYSGLRQPLEADQVAPFGFLSLMKWFGEITGFTEEGLRLPIFLVALLSVYAFYFLVRRVSDRNTALLGLALFATNNWLIYFSAETKQYTFDVLASLVVLFLGLLILKRYSQGRAVALALTGALVVWFSHPSAFVLCAVGLVLMWEYWRADRRRVSVAVALMSMVWLGSFAFHLWFSSALGTDVTANQQNLYWSRAFAPLPPTSIDEALWFPGTLIGMFRWPFSFELTGLAAASAAAGVFAIWQRSPAIVCMLVGPLVLALLASAFKLYPFTGRLLLFAAPAVIILVAEGVALFVRWSWSRSRALAAVVPLLLLFHPLGSTARQAIAPKPYLRDDVVSILQPIAQNYQAGDRMWLYGSIEKAYRFYAPRFGLDRVQKTIVPRPGDWEAYINSLSEFRCGGRTWLVFGHIRRRPHDDETRLLFEADRLGIRLASFRASHESPLKPSLHEATAYLYDFNDSGCLSASSGDPDTFDGTAKVFP